MTYAIVEVSGKQMFMEAGKFYDLNYISGSPGDIIDFNRVLFIYKDDLFKVGNPCLQKHSVKGKILKHIKGRKLIVFKIKPKKNIRRKKGHRQALTRVLVEDII
uniref:Large ribosomal subunit protein bL21c n=1 Tax=Caloglossa beccarii TaxID=131038 RepID=A0A1Z1M878_9FLOR|nr:ribosomal protein L21 [Caloglossa beccarii]ARW62206.1 ribosomal protein L21 [Caloglossa beccarii]